MDGTFDLSGALRRIRRIADLSQRELAAAVGTSAAAIARAESGTRNLTVSVLIRAAALAQLRLALLDGEGREITGMDPDAVRDLGYRRFPAHLDTRYSDEWWWHAPIRYTRPEPWYTFDRDRGARDYRRERAGTPNDHQLPQPGDSPAERRRAARSRREPRELRELPELPDLVCTCPPECEELDQGERPVHAPHCACGCDVD